MEINPHRRSPILKLPGTVNLEQLKHSLSSAGVLERLKERNSLSLMHRPGVVDPWLDGVTPQVLKPGESFSFSESDFTEINPGLEEGCFPEVLERLHQAAMGRLGRVRLFLRPPQSCSSLHRDLDVRIHLSLETNSSSFLVFPRFGVYHIPCDGHLYLVDTTEPHFAVNADSKQPRTHLVCSTTCGFKEERGRETEILRAAQLLYSACSNDPGTTELIPLSP